MHFVSPGPYLAITPPVLLYPRALVAISGLAEIAGGLGVLFPLTRRLAAIGLILLLLAVFPANVFAALHGMIVFGRPAPGWILWVRLPLQLILVAWVYFAAWKGREAPR